MWDVKEAAVIWIWHLVEFSITVRQKILGTRDQWLQHTSSAVAAHGL